MLAFPRTLLSYPPPSLFGSGSKLVTSNMPRDATLATLLGQGVWYLLLLGPAVFCGMILFGAICAAVLLAQVASCPHQERLSRLADNRWLPWATIGVTGLLLIGPVAGLWFARMYSMASLLSLCRGCPDRLRFNVG